MGSIDSAQRACETVKVIEALGFLLVRCEAVGSTEKALTETASERGVSRDGLERALALLEAGSLCRAMSDLVAGSLTLEEAASVLG